MNWEMDLFPKISKIVKDTIYSASDVIKNTSNSFELYGFDFVLDYKLNPWLIEVNLSPACCERTDWLKDMLGIFPQINKLIDHMAEGLIDIIEPKLPKIPKSKEIEKNKNEEFTWKLIYDQRNDMNHICSHKKKTQAMNDNIEVIGNQINIRSLKKVEKIFLIAQSARLINKFVR